MNAVHWALERPYWQYTATVAVVSALTFLVLRRNPDRRAMRVSAFARDLALIATVFAIYQHTVHYARLHTAGAFDHARSVIDIEQFLHIQNEVGLQKLLLPHAWIVKSLNGYYAGVHLISMILFVLWVLWWHRDAYPTIRNIIFASTLTCVLIQIYPVAPPRLMPEIGFVDTAVTYGQSVYGAGGYDIAGQLAAMPSIHVAWAFIIAWYAVKLSNSPWRWIFPAHFAMTVLVVTATANHWYLDGIVAIGIVLLAMTAEHFYEQAKAAHRARRAETEPAMVSA